MSQAFKDAVQKGDEAQVKRLTELYRYRGILDKWHDKTWDDYVNDARAKRILQSYDTKKALQKGVGYYLFGDNGVGKTLTMNLVFQDLIHKGHSVHIISLTSLITKFTAGWYDTDERASLVHLLQKVDFLGIEEIGKEYKAGSNDLGLMVFDNVLRYRVQMRKPVWFTSNKAPISIKDVYSEDIASMLRECCVDLQLKGKDYRSVIANQIKEDFKNEL